MKCLSRRAVLMAAAGAVTAPEARPSAPPKLRRGVNLTNWFRFPPSADPASLGRYMPDALLTQLTTAGFDFVRLPVEPARVATAADRRLVLGAISRLNGAGLRVVLDLHPTGWPADFSPLAATWASLAPDLAGTDPNRLVIEIVNEPAFAADPAPWWVLQRAVLAVIRRSLPQHTVLCTGADWGSLDGLLALSPLPDPNLIYSFHFYEPLAWTTLAVAWRGASDERTLAALPFPAAGPGCVPPNARAPGADLARDYCASGWDAARIAARIAGAGAWRRAHGVTVLAGEFGASALHAPASRLAWINAARMAFEAEGIGWALWGLEDKHGFDLTRPPPADARLDPALCAALGLKSPR